MELEMERAYLRTAIMLLLVNSNDSKGVPLNDAIIVLESVLDDLKITRDCQKLLAKSATPE